MRPAIATESTAENPARRQTLGEYDRTLARSLLAHPELKDERTAVVGLTSGGPGEGVTTVVVHLAEAAVQVSGRRVLVVETKPSGLAQRLEGEPRDGFAELMTGAAALGDCVYPSQVPGVSLLGGGRPRGADGQTLDRARLETLVDEARSEFGLVLFDLPNLSESETGFALAQALDGVVLVLEAGSSDKEVARRVRVCLENYQIPLLGAVLNRAVESQRVNFF